MLCNIVKENMEFGIYPFGGFHIIVMLILPIMSQATHSGKWLSLKKYISFVISL